MNASLFGFTAQEVIDAFNKMAPVLRQIHRDVTWTVDVGHTTVRPVIPDQHISRVVLYAEDEVEAVCVAAAMVMRRDVEMVTSTVIVDWPDDLLDKVSR